MALWNELLKNRCCGGVNVVQKFGEGHYQPPLFCEPWLTVNPLTFEFDMRM